MEVNVSQEEYSFKPVEITIKLETKNDFECFKDLIDNHAPNTLCSTPLSTRINLSRSRKHLDFASRFLTKVSDSLRLVKL